MSGPGGPRHADNPVRATMSRRAAHVRKFAGTALVAALISLAAFGAMQAMGDKIDTMYNNVSNHMN